MIILDTAGWDRSNWQFSWDVEIHPLLDEGYSKDYICQVISYINKNTAWREQVLSAHDLA